MSKGSRTPAQVRTRSSVIVAAGAIAALAAVAFVPANLAPEGPRRFVAVLLGVAALFLLVGVWAFRSRGIRWVCAVAALVSIAGALIVAAIPREREPIPVTVTNFPKALAPTGSPESAPTTEPYGGGWGPDRDLFTVASPARHPAINSITDNPAHGDERNFVQVKMAGEPNSTYTDTLRACPGDRVTLFAFVNNSATGGHGQGLALKEPRAALSSVNVADHLVAVGVTLSADNADEVYDGALVTCPDAPIGLTLINDTARMHSADGHFALPAADGATWVAATRRDGSSPLGFDRHHMVTEAGYMTFGVLVTATGTL